jgi:hypothetical protein
VAERIDRAGAGITVSVPAGISLIVEQPAVRRARMRGQSARKPRLRSGWALKRQPEGDSGRPYVLKDLRSAAFVRLADADAELVGLLDGEHDRIELIGATGARSGLRLCRHDRCVV